MPARRRPDSAGRLSSRPGPPTHPPLGPGVCDLAAAGLPDALLAVPVALRSPPPLLVFLHGAGGDGRGSLPFVQRAAEDAGVLVLLPTSAAATWDLLTGGVLGPDVAALDAALAHVVQHFDVGPVAIGGFSDGASYALSIGLANGDLAAALMAFSPGFVAPPAQVGRPRVWLSHGTADAVLPVDRCGRTVVRTLEGSGYDVTYEEFAGGHVVPADLVRAAFAWWLG